MKAKPLTREEAIGTVNELRELRHIHFLGICGNCKKKKAIAEFLMERFRITEEDLK